MSGRKVSQIRIDAATLRRIQQQRAEQERIRRERIERSKALESISQQQQNITATSNQLRDLLKSTPSGIKETFRESVQEAERWMNTIQTSMKEFNKNDTNAALKHHFEKIESLQLQGQRSLKNLTRQFTKDADNITKSAIEDLLELNSKFGEKKEDLIKWAGFNTVNTIIKDLAELDHNIKEKRLKEAVALKNRIAGNLNSQIQSVEKLSSVFNQYEQDKELLQSWFDVETKNIERKFDDIKQNLIQGKSTEIYQHLTEMQKKLDMMINEAKDLNEKDQKRQYVLESLKKVCNSMGFEEVSQTVEGTGKSNRIVYIIDTFSHGKIKFSLSLDSINADSGIADNHCMNEFDKVSESLQKNFGIQTKFKRVSEETGPIKKRTGTIDGGGEDKVAYGERE